MLIDWTQAKLPLTAAEALAAAKLAKIKEIKDDCDAAGATLTASYPEIELRSWAQQVKEADAYSADPAAPVPHLASIAAVRGVEVAELVRRVHTKVEFYSVASGALIGKRQALEDAIDAAHTVTEVQAITWSDPG